MDAAMDETSAAAKLENRDEGASDSDEYRQALLLLSLLENLPGLGIDEMSATARGTRHRRIGVAVD